MLGVGRDRLRLSGAHASDGVGKSSRWFGGGVVVAVARAMVGVRGSEENDMELLPSSSSSSDFVYSLFHRVAWFEFEERA